MGLRHWKATTSSFAGSSFLTSAGVLQGKILFQESISITKDETAKSLKEKINALELKFYPRIIEYVIIEKCQ